MATRQEMWRPYCWEVLQGDSLEFRGQLLERWSVGQEGPEFVSLYALEGGGWLLEHEWTLPEGLDGVAYVCAAVHNLADLVHVGLQGGWPGKPLEGAAAVVSKPWTPPTAPGRVVRGAVARFHFYGRRLGRVELPPDPTGFRRVAELYKLGAGFVVYTETPDSRGRRVRHVRITDDLAAVPWPAVVDDGPEVRDYLARVLRQVEQARN